jgi:hypothetical protein
LTIVVAALRFVIHSTPSIDSTKGMSISESREDPGKFVVKELPGGIRQILNGAKARGIPNVSNYVENPKFDAPAVWTSTASFPRSPSVSPKSSIKDFQSGKPPSTAASTVDGDPKETATTVTRGSTAETK